MCFGEKWWSVTVDIDIDQLKLCYPEDNGSQEKNRWFHTVEHVLSMPQRLYMESGVQRTVARKIICDKVHSALRERYGDFFDSYPYTFNELFFIFESASEDSESPRFADRVMA